jgi:nucleoid-associated protein YgaU
MRARKPGRYLAPLALVAVIVATALVVRAGTQHTPHATTSTPPARLPSTRRARPRKTFYVIRAGDSLSGISVKTGVPVATLEALNPSVDPNALQTGQRLRLRR